MEAQENQLLYIPHARVHAAFVFIGLAILPSHEKEHKWGEGIAYHQKMQSKVTINHPLTLVRMFLC